MKATPCNECIWYRQQLCFEMSYKRIGKKRTRSDIRTTFYMKQLPIFWYNKNYHKAQNISLNNMKYVKNIRKTYVKNNTCCR